MPKHGNIITFTVVPAGSYCSVGVAYRVDRPTGKGSFRFENVATGNATIDPAWAVARSTYSVQP